MSQSIAGGGEAVFAREKSAPAKLQDFIIRKMIGKGTFGKVFLVEHNSSGKLYAMKCIRKDKILEHDQMENIQLEKNILFTVDHPFLVNMEYVFQNEFRIYFLMKFVKGGELFRHLVEVRIFPENQAKFFAAQVAMALAHLHSKKIIYRDLKPENVLVGEDGYLLVADFGLAKFVQQGELANSFCGTAEYLAPEMLIGNGHDFTVDWWALGILIFEMVVGIPPFFHRNKHRMYFLIRESPVNFPDPVRHKITVSPEAQDLIVKLLDKNRMTRLGVNGVQEILSHPWFKDLDMDKLLKKELTPPYIPKVKADLAYFDKNLTSQTEVADTILSVGQRQMINKDANKFEGFSS